MKRKKKLVVTLTAIIVISIWIISFLSPEWTIRRHILEHLQPINSLKADISSMGIVDPEYGHLYNVTKFMDRQTGGEVGVIYLKKAGLFWYVASAGTGP